MPSGWIMFLVNFRASTLRRKHAYAVFMHRLMMWYGPPISRPASRTSELFICNMASGLHVDTNLLDAVKRAGTHLSQRGRARPFLSTALMQAFWYA